ncbi:MAG TPA: tetratricopeptide repeat protein [Cytophagaceae bacterium]
MRLILFFFFFLAQLNSFGQSIYQDKEVQKVIQQGLDKTYNFQFYEAELLYQEVRKQHPNSPAYNFLMAVNNYWRILQENKFKEKSKEYLSYLELALKQTEKTLEKDPKNLEGIFFSMIIHSSYTLYHTRNKDNLKTIGSAKQTYNFMKQGFKLKEKFADFYFSTGIYDYYVVQYPESNSAFRPFMWFFASGDKQRGLSELEIASKQAIFVRTESMNYLSNIYLKYESKPAQSLVYISQIAKKYPNNFYFTVKHTEALIGAGKYEEAEKYILPLYYSGHRFFEMASFVFSAEVYEKYRNKLDAAKIYYQKAVNAYSKVDAPVKDYLSFAYCGLARIADKQGDKKSAKDYYEKALKVAEYNWVKKEANEYLDRD